MTVMKRVKKKVDVSGVKVFVCPVDRLPGEPLPGSSSKKRRLGKGQTGDSEKEREAAEREETSKTFQEYFSSVKEYGKSTLSGMAKKKHKVCRLCCTVLHVLLASHAPLPSPLYHAPSNTPRLTFLNTPLPHALAHALPHQSDKLTALGVQPEKTQTMPFKMAMGIIAGREKRAARVRNDAQQVGYCRQPALTSLPSNPNTPLHTKPTPTPITEWHCASLQSAAQEEPRKGRRRPRRRPRWWWRRRRWNRPQRPWRCAACQSRQLQGASHGRSRRRRWWRRSRQRWWWWR